MPPHLLLLLLDMTAPEVGLRLCSIGNYARGDSRGTEATVVRHIIATIKDGGRHCRQFQHLAVVSSVPLCISQSSTFYSTHMLPLEVVGPGGSLSVLLFITSYWRDANRRMQW
jgi:hypothetical protein